MRLFKTNQAERSEEDQAAAERLMAIASRCKPAGSLDMDEETSPEETPEAPEILQ